MRVGKAGIGDEGDEGLARLLEELAAESGAAHGAAFHGFFERERLGELFEHPLHHRFETRTCGGIGFGEDAGLAERDGLFLRSVVKQCEEFQQQTGARELAGGGHVFQQDEGGSRGGGSEGNTALRRGKEPPHFALAAQPAQRVLGRQMKLKHVAIGAALLHPAMREVAAEQHAVPLAECADMVADVARPGTALENGELHLRVAVPATADAGLRRAAPSGLQGEERACISLPAQQAEAFAGGEADVFEQDGHCPEIITSSGSLSNAVRRYGQYLRRGGEIPAAQIAILLAHERAPHFL